MVERSRVSRVVVAQELGLVGGHIDVDRALALAAFAGQAEIKRFFNLIVAPAAFDDLALEHLPEQVGAAAGAVLFLECDLVARAHRARILFTARTDAHAALQGLVQGTLVIGEMEVRVPVIHVIVGTELEIFLRLVGVDELARIHLPVRIPEALELGERLTQLRPKHFRIKKRARLPVPMLATDAPAVSDDQVPGLLNEAPELTHTLRRFPSRS